MTRQDPADSGTDQALSPGLTGSPRGFAADVMSLSFSSAVSQALKLCSAPLISRLFGPASFGAASVFDSAGRTLVPITALGYSASLVLPEDRREAANVFALCCLLVLCATGAAAALVALAGDALLTAAHIEQLIPLKWLFPVAVLLGGIVEPLSFWYTRHKQFRRKAAALVAGTSLSVSVILVLGFLGFTGGQSLVLGMMLIPFGIAALLAAGFVRDDMATVARAVSAREMWRAARRHRQFPMFGAWSQLLNIASLQVPPILLAGMFDPQTAGLYAYSVAILAMPMSVITLAIGDVFYQHATATRDAGGDLSGLVLAVFKSLLAVALLPVVLVILVGPELFSLLLGPQWRESGVYSAILAPWLLTSFVFAPISSLYAILGRQRTFLLFNLVLFGGRVAIILVGARAFGEVRPVLALFSAFGAAVLTTQIRHLAAALQSRVSLMIKQVLLHLAYVGPTVAIFFVARWALALEGPVVIVAAGAAGVPYAVIVLRRDKELSDVFQEIAGKCRRTRT